ncbi:maltokinase N-terminal cap-like domain-containing protein [Brevibacterium ihuae]|uniref:maltokinase N-terminal cap-like domain-containing protein n=1 Tax=Brevibacterium ihuae TaxID=1631743 RepID=UPI000C76B487|nr:hypothetical protein [Brevibacterium ihuae]
MAISSDLEQLLSAWLPRQGWFPKLETELGADPDITPMSITRLFEFDTARAAAEAAESRPAPAAEPAAPTTTEHYRIVDNRAKAEPAADAEPEREVGTVRNIGTVQGHQAIISVGDGRTLRRLNIPLSYRTEEDYALRPHLIGTVDDITLGRCYVYDGCADPIFVLASAQAMAAGRRFEGGQVQADRVGEHGHPFAALDDPGTLLAHADVIRLGLLESRTNESSVVIDDPADPCVLTFFRVIRPGLSSAVRIPVALTEAESGAVPEVIGWSAGRWFDAADLDTQSAPLAILSRTERDSQPAWREAVDIACAVDSGSIGSYNKRAMALGTRVGELHLDLAAEFGVVRSMGEPTAEWVKKWQDRVDWALARAPLALGALGSRLRAHRDGLRELESLGGLQRIHGELTLNQVVSSPGAGFRVVNFSEETQEFPKPAAIDLVALLRSIDYAAGYARLRRTGALDLDAQPVVLGFSGLEESGESMQEVVDSPEYLWSSQAQNSLLTGYSHAVNASVGLHDPVLRAVLIDRLLVEVVTELRNRPTWLIVPLATLTLLLGGRLEHDVPSDDEDGAARAWVAPESSEVSAEEFSQASADRGPVIPAAESRARGAAASGSGAADTSGTDTARGTAGAAAPGAAIAGAEAAAGDDSDRAEAVGDRSVAGAGSADSTTAAGSDGAFGSDSEPGDADAVTPVGDSDTEPSDAETSRGDVADAPDVVAAGSSDDSGSALADADVASESVGSEFIGSDEETAVDIDAAAAETDDPLPGSEDADTSAPADADAGEPADAAPSAAVVGEPEPGGSAAEVSESRDAAAEEDDASNHEFADVFGGMADDPDDPLDEYDVEVEDPQSAPSDPADGQPTDSASGDRPVDPTPPLPARPAAPPRFGTDR